MALLPTASLCQAQCGNVVCWQNDDRPQKSFLYWPEVYGLLPPSKKSRQGWNCIKAVMMAGITRIVFQVTQPHTGAGPKS